MSNRKEYTENFKLQLVQLYNAGATQVELRDQYDVKASTLHQWIKKYNTIGIPNTATKLSSAEIELIELKRELKQAKMENDILKQAAVIMGRK